MKLTNKYVTEATDCIANHHARIMKIMNDSFFHKKPVSETQSNTITIDDAMKLTGKPRNFFIQHLHEMLRDLRNVYNKKYLKDFGKPKSEQAMMTYNKELNEIQMHVSIKIVGRSNLYIYKAQTIFELDDSNHITGIHKDNNQYMVSMMGKEKEIQSIDDIKDPNLFKSQETSEEKETEMIDDPEESFVLDELRSGKDTIKI